MEENKKMKKLITFDLLDVQLLEVYLKEMATKGWLIDEIGVLSIYFKKCKPQDLDFFVDITTREILNEYEMPRQEYLDKYMTNNLEHIYGNKKFQIFINHGNKDSLERNKPKFSKIFYRPIILLLLATILLYNYIQEAVFVLFISNNRLILTGILLTIIFTIILLINLMNINKYINKDNNNFDFRKSFKINNKLIKVEYYLIIIFMIISIINWANQSGITSKLPTKSDLPISLEDFNGKISSIRQIDIEEYSSVFATYNRYMDSTYEEVYETKYDKKTKSEYEDIIMKDLYDLDYTVFESENKIIMNKVIEDELKIRQTYIKCDNKDDLKIWEAKEIYYDKESSGKIIVYENKMVSIYTNIELDKMKINFIKKNLLNK